MAGRSRSLTVILLLAPAVVFMIFFYLGGITTVIVESFQTYVPGRIVHTSFHPTLQNYAQYFSGKLVYYGFLWDTLRLAGIAVVISMLIAYPYAYKIVRAESARVKKVLLTALIVSFFASSITKVYSWVIVLGDAGLINSILLGLGFNEVRFLGSDWAVIVGLTYFLMTVAAITLLGPINNIAPSLEEASMNLGATKTKTFLKVTLPLSMPGIIAATLLTYALGVSEFVVPAFLGKGIVLMMSNIIYLRFADTFNYPGGSALSVVLLATTLIIAYGINKIMAKWLKGFRSLGER